MIYFKKFFIEKLKKTTNKFKLKILISLINLYLSRDNKLCIKNVKYLDLAVLDRTVISTEVVTKIYLPNFGAKDVDTFIEVNSPEIQLLKLENCIISGGNSCFINGDDLYIERYCNEDNTNANYSSGCFWSHNDVFALVRKSDFSAYVDNGFLLAGNGAWNYYHWLIEILPKLQFYLELGLYKQGIKLIVPNAVEKNENLRFLLDSILGDVKVDIIFAPHDFSLHIKNLYHLTPINNILFNERKIGLKKSILHIRYDSLAFLTSRIEYLVSLSTKEMFSVERIFLARKETGARSYNQSEIIPFLTKHNFEIIYMEDHCVAQQIYLFKNAKYIVGASGAAWTNLIFCHSSCRALTWLPESIQSFPAFSTLAKFKNVNLSFFTTPSNHYKAIHDSYIIDIKTFEMHLGKLLI